MSTFVSRLNPLLIKVYLASLALTAVAERTAVTNESPAAPAFAGSVSCRECHQKFYDLWSTSFHGLAMQPYTADLAKKLPPHTNEIVAGKYRFQVDPVKGVVTERTSAGAKDFKISQTTGGKNVFYFLTELERGWLQVLPVAYDVKREEWFDTTASAVRHFGDRRDEALYWKERPLTFNTSCFSCHVSQMSKNYDLKNDSYRTTWAEPGINCETCHGPSAEHARIFKEWKTNQPPPSDLKLIVTKKLTIEQRNDMCAPCHAKMSPVTAEFTPGEKYFDHFDLVGLESPDFYPDGRDLGENYTFTQWRSSPCAKSGKLDCIHCHTSSGRYRFHDPAQANDACLPCHKEKVTDAPAHTRHKTGTEGNKCISCHMPMTEFARMWRTDHSMRPPTPAATLKYKSPNACNLCHTNDAAWADKIVREWRQRDYQKPVLERAALIDAARKSDWTKLPDILAYLDSKDRDELLTVSLVRLLSGCADERKTPALRKLMADKSPWVRASAVEALGQTPNEQNIPLLAQCAADESRLVRVRAASVLAPVPQAAIPEKLHTALEQATKELMASMQARPDEMASHYNLGNFYSARGKHHEALASFQTAIRLQPDALPPYVNSALLFNTLGQNDKAEESLKHALRLDPTNSAVHVNLGMLLAEMNRLPEAEMSFRAAFSADPTSAQAAYNLGVMLAKDRPQEALTWCSKAAALRPQEARYAYTLAFFQHQQGKTAEAIVTLEKTLKGAPDHVESYAMLGHIYERQSKPHDAARVYKLAEANGKLPAQVRRQFGGRAQELSP